MHAIQEWINNHLIEWGIISSSANELDNTIVLLLIIAVTVGIDYACRYIFLNMFKRLAKRTRNQWDDLIVERKIINKLMHMIPAILVYVLLPLAFPVDETPKILGILQMICKIYIIAVSLRFISASLNVVHEIYNRKESLKNKPLKGFIQLLQVAVFFIGFILIISILIGKSPTTLFAGLGASAAILMLVFKDTLLGFVGGHTAFRQRYAASGRLDHDGEIWGERDGYRSHAERSQSQELRQYDHDDSPLCLSERCFPELAWDVRISRTADQALHQYRYEQREFLYS